MGYTPYRLIESGGNDGTALTASTTPTSILHPASLYEFDPNEMFRGMRLQLRAGGRVSNVVTTPGTLTLDVRGQGIVVFNGQAIPLNTTAKTNVPWGLTIDMELRSVGSGTSAQFLSTGVWTSESVVGSAVGEARSAALPVSTAPAVGTGFNSGALFSLDLFATWSLNNANSIQTHWYELWVMNMPA